ncbi:hypothetical protein GCM10022243_03650 [Saccharothrix violaceirubra]|uniref:Uncharacterized protein n=1 Tax=Saccharothrix violaceirubra TaxID=413306 RepID=A0A7W7WV38_9PSEU|nr:hypothetical protein [Saccharothrix violaceirubra]MBB4964113.1 hypothetical protein [Saccharothrix violaceirubra]
MLFAVLLSVLAALGLLVPAFTTGQDLWAWLSVGASGLAAVLLVLDRALRRRSGTTRSEVTGPGEEPGEEDTSADDLLIVAGLHDEVRVLDERPRYHLDTCPWVGAHATLPLPVSEARQLGFTPCDVCTPDVTLVARARPT